MTPYTRDFIGRRRIADIAFHYLCLSYGMSPATMRGPSRKAPTVRARQACMYAVKHISGAGRTILARVFHRDPGTILHGTRQHEKLLKESTPFSTARA